MFSSRSPETAAAPKRGAARKFKCGWYGDGGLGERMISAILSGRKSATSCPAYDPEDAELRVGDRLELTDKHGRARGELVVTRIELRPYGSFDESVAAACGSSGLSELRENTRFANGREIRADEEMRVVHLRVVGVRHAP